MKARFAKEGADTVGSAPDQALGYLREEIERWVSAVNRYKVVAE